MRQCDHPPCQTDGRLWDNDKCYCIRHYDPKKRKVPNQKAIKKAPAAKKAPVKKVPRPQAEGS